MSRSVSFLRRINFSKPLGHAALWIESADLYEDENRIYAFLTFSSGVNPTIEKCKIRITPFDKDKFGMDSFGVRILNLNLKGNQKKEHPDPLILPKGTYGFNFSILSYGTKKVEKEVPPVVAAAPSPAKPEEAEAKEAPIESASPVIAEPSSPSIEEAPKEEIQETPQPRKENPEDPRNPNKVSLVKEIPFLAILLLVVMGVIIGYWLFVSGQYGRNFR